MIIYPVWMYITGEWGFSKPVILGDTLLTLNRNGFLYAFDFSSGRLLYKTKIEDVKVATTFSDINFKGDTLIFSSIKGFLYMFLNGKVIRKLRIEPSVIKPVIYKDYIVVPTITGRVFFIKGERVLKVLDFGVPIWTSPVKLKDLMIIIAGNRARVFNDTTLKCEFEKAHPEHGLTFSQHLPINDSLFIFITEKGQINVVSTDCKLVHQRLLWSKGRWVRVISPLVSNGKYVAIIGKEGSFFLYDPLRDSVICNSHLSGFYHYFNITDTAKGYFAVASMGGSIYLIDDRCEIRGKVSSRGGIGAFIIFKNSIFINGESYVERLDFADF